MDFYPLHEAAISADTKAVVFLIKAGVPLNELDKLGHSPLHWAVFGGYEDIAQALLEAGADPNIFSEDGVTPKWRARDFGLVEIEQLLTEYGGIIDTNERFDRNAFQLFNELIGLPLPQEESALPTQPSKLNKLLQNLKSWRLNK
jgi:ankyrin repeat protein